jgi:signal transduction histidine kinase
MQENFLGIINEECDRLARMVNDVLDLSRMDSGRRRLKTEPVSLARLVRDVQPTVEPALREKRLELRSAVSETLPAVEADPDLLKQVLVNLIHNAAKFSREDSEIEVAADIEGDRVPSLGSRPGGRNSRGQARPRLRPVLSGRGARGRTAPEAPASGWRS